MFNILESEEYEKSLYSKVLPGFELDQPFSKQSTKSAVTFIERVLDIYNLRYKIDYKNILIVLKDFNRTIYIDLISYSDKIKYLVVGEENKTLKTPKEYIEYIKNLIKKNESGSYENKLINQAKLTTPFDKISNKTILSLIELILKKHSIKYEKVGEDFYELPDSIYNLDIEYKKCKIVSVMISVGDEVFNVFYNFYEFLKYAPKHIRQLKNSIISESTDFEKNLFSKAKLSTNFQNISNDNICKFIETILNKINIEYLTKLDNRSNKEFKIKYLNNVIQYGYTEGGKIVHVNISSINQSYRFVLMKNFKELITTLNEKVKPFLEDMWDLTKNLIDYYDGVEYHEHKDKMQYFTVFLDVGSSGYKKKIKAFISVNITGKDKENRDLPSTNWIVFYLPKELSFEEAVRYIEGITNTDTLPV